MKARLAKSQHWACQAPPYSGRTRCRFQGLHLQLQLTPINVVKQGQATLQIWPCTSLCAVKQPAQFKVMRLLAHPQPDPTTTGHRKGLVRQWSPRGLQPANPKQPQTLARQWYPRGLQPVSHMQLLIRQRKADQSELLAPWRPAQ